MFRNLLSRHPSIAICGETRFFADVYKYRSAFGSLENPENRRRLVDQCLATARMRRLGMDSESLRPKLLEQATSYPAFFETVIRGFSEFHGKERCGEKTPHHAFHTETLSDWYPGAYIIHLVRDPRDVVASLQRMPWAPKSILNNAWIWVLFNRAVERSSHRPGYLLVQYERLVSSPQEELSRIADHIGEQWPASLDVATGEQSEYSWPRSTRGPVTRERLQKWKTELSAQDVAIVERIVGSRLQQYGYVSNGGSASPAGLMRAAALAGYDLARQRLADLPYFWSHLTSPTNLPLQEYLKYRRVWEAVFPGLSPQLGPK
jgi:Sulfotransferase family